MNSNNTHDTKCESTPVAPPNIKFLMEPMSILANLGSNLVWFTSISKLTNGSHPNYDQGCRLGELLQVGEGGGPLRDEEPLRLIHLGSRGLFASVGSLVPVKSTDLPRLTQFRGQDLTSFLQKVEDTNRSSLGNPSILPPGNPWLYAATDAL